VSDELKQPLVSFARIGADIVKRWGRRTASMDALIPALSTEDSTKCVLCYIAWILERPLRDNVEAVQQAIFERRRAYVEWLLDDFDPPCPGNVVDRLSDHLNKQHAADPWGLSIMTHGTWDPERQREARKSHWSYWPKSIAGKKTKMQKAYEEWVAVLIRKQKT